MLRAASKDFDPNAMGKRAVENTDNGTKIDLIRNKMAATIIPGVKHNMPC